MFTEKLSFLIKKNKNFFCSPTYDGEGGRRCHHLMSLVSVARKYKSVFVIVGDNDAKTRSVQYICLKFMEFRDAIWPTQVIFAGHMRRNDLPAKLVAENNMFLRNNLGYQLRSTKIIRREDFDSNCPFHFDKFGEGFRHMGALILSVLNELSSS